MCAVSGDGIIELVVLMGIRSVCRWRGCRVARESMEVEQALWAVARDAAYEALTEPPTREAYEKLIHLNNAELLPNNCIRIVKRIQRGQEILVTFGWDFYERVTPLTLAKMRQQDTRNMSRE